MPQSALWYIASPTFMTSVWLLWRKLQPKPAFQQLSATALAAVVLRAIMLLFFLPFAPGVDLFFNLVVLSGWFQTICFRWTFQKIIYLPCESPSWHKPGWSSDKQHTHQRTNDTLGSRWFQGFRQDGFFLFINLYPSFWTTNLHKSERTQKSHWLGFQGFRTSFMPAHHVYCLTVLSFFSCHYCFKDPPQNKVYS